MIIAISNFAGIAPMLAPHMLAPNQAQIARNCRLWNGGIDCIREPSNVTITTKSSAQQALYKFGQSNTSDTDWWLTWQNAVSVAKGPIALDTEEKTYYAGDGPLKYTNAQLALTGGSNNYPVNWRYAGVPAPELAPTVAAIQGTPLENELAETTAYVYCFVGSNGELSAPSPAAIVDERYPSLGVTVGNLLPPQTGGVTITHKRIYRTSSGSSGTNYYFVADVLAGDDAYTDTVQAENLGEPIQSLNWNLPPGHPDNADETRPLQGLIALPNGIMAGFVGNDVYLSEPFRPYAWPVAYMQTTDFPIVALAALGQNVLVLTTGTPYMIYAADPGSSSMERLDIHQACVSRRSVAPFLNGVVFASPDGMIYVGTDGSRNLTQNWFSREQWQTLKPESMHGAQHDGRYYGFFKVSEGNSGGFILDPNTNNGVFTSTDIYADACYSSLVQDGLFFVSGQNIKKWEGTSTLRPYVWRSKVFPTPRPTNFSAAQVIAGDYSNLTVKFYHDGVLKHTQAVTSSEPFRLPSGFLASRHEVEFTGTSNVLGFAMAESLVELTNA